MEKLSRYRWFIQTVTPWGVKLYDENSKFYTAFTVPIISAFTCFSFLR